MADFETTTDPEDCRVWGWAVCEIYDTEKITYGGDISSYLTHMAQFSSYTYFHNLKFDGVFILDFIMKQGFRHTTERVARKGEFTTLISDAGEFYSITVRWRNGNTTEFRDSMKKLPMSVANIAKAFKLDDGKGEIDYHLERPIGWVMTEEEREYMRRDVVIVAQAIRMELDAGMSKLTVGADSLAEYRRLMSPKLFARFFPILPETMDADIRRAYRGGFTYADPRFAKRVLGEGATYDVNSLYPSVMYDRVLPYDYPIYSEDMPEVTEDFPLFIVNVTFVAKIKKDHIPCIQIKGSSRFAETEYLREVKEPTNISITNVDLALWEDHYDFEILEVHGAWRFKGIEGLFCRYIDKWMGVKENSDGGIRAIAKLHLTSLYGKFATNPNVTGRIPIIKDDRVSLVTGEPETRDPVYTAMGVFITAYARDVTIRAAQRNYSVFAYADTDSLHLMTQDEPDGIIIHKSKLGTWKHEYDFTSAYFAQAKRYTQLTVEGAWITHIAGLAPSLAKGIRYEHYLTGATLHGKKVPKKVPGGIVIRETTFSLGNR